MASDNSFMAFFSGKLSKDTLIKKLIPAIIAIILLSIFISNLLYPAAYDWRFVVISGLLDSGENPIGNYFLSIGMTVLGILMIPMIGYFQKRLGKICKGVAGTGTFFFLLGIIGLISVGTIGQVIHTIDKFHEILAGIGFLGLLLSAFFYGFPIMKDRNKGAKQFNMKVWTILSIILWIPVIGMAAASLMDPGWGWVDLSWINEFDPDYVGTAPVLLKLVLSFAFWEWLLFGAVMAYMIIFAFFVPDNIIPFQKKPRKGKKE
ncbi:MAG: hypothetical protein ACTSU9_16105 [Promethearchaeota archaeon]